MWGEDEGRERTAERGKAEAKDGIRKCGMQPWWLSDNGYLAGLAFGEGGEDSGHKRQQVLKSVTAGTDHEQGYIEFWDMLLG